MLVGNDEQHAEEDFETQWEVAKQRILPESLLRLEGIFLAVETVLGCGRSLRRKVPLDKLKTAVELHLTNMGIAEPFHVGHLEQVASLLPGAYKLDKLKSGGGRSWRVQMGEVDQSTINGAASTKARCSRESTLLVRRRLFRRATIEFVRERFQGYALAFLHGAELECWLKESAKMVPRHWHPGFDLSRVADVPRVPVVETTGPTNDIVSMNSLLQLGFKQRKVAPAQQGETLEIPSHVQVSEKILPTATSSLTGEKVVVAEGTENKDLALVSQLAVNREMLDSRQPKASEKKASKSIYVGTLCDAIRMRECGLRSRGVSDAHPTGQCLSLKIHPSRTEYRTHALQAANQMVYFPDEGTNADSFGPALCCRFDRTGQYVATGYENGAVSIIDSSQFSAGPRLQEDNSILSVGSDGCRTGLPLASFAAHSDAIFDLTWFHGGRSILTASGDNTVQVNDVETLAPVAVFQGHTQSVKRIAPLAIQDESKNRPSSAVFATASRDGSVRVWDERTPGSRTTLCGALVHQAEITIANAHTSPGRMNPDVQGLKNCSVTDLVSWSDGQVIISSGDQDGCVKLWDLRMLRESPECRKSTMKKLQPFISFNPSQAATHGGRSYGISSLAYDQNSSSILANCRNGRIYLYELDDLLSTAPNYTGGCIPSATFTGHQTDSFYVRSCFSPCGNFIISSSSDRNVFVWDKHDPYELPMVLSGHTMDANGVDWNPINLNQVVSSGDDGSVRVWHLNMVPTLRKTRPRQDTTLTVQGPAHFSKRGNCRAATRRRVSIKDFLVC